MAVGQDLGEDFGSFLCMGGQMQRPSLSTWMQSLPFCQVAVNRFFASLVEDTRGLSSTVF